MKCIYNLTLVMLKILSQPVLDMWVMVFRVRLKKTIIEPLEVLESCFTKIGIDYDSTIQYHRG